MAFKHLPIDGFLDDAREIKKTYPDFGNDLKRVRLDLSDNPVSKAEASLGGGLYKYRTDITGKPSGKSFGARIVYLVITHDYEIWYLACFDKSDLKNLTKSELAQLKKLAKQMIDLPSKERLDKFGAVSLIKKESKKYSPE
jgi:hypothetical protein